MNITVVVMNNSAMGRIKWEQAVFWDGKFVSTVPKFTESTKAKELMREDQ
jgi:thiamine pyrophosphate-dependent acetolactate synthase large subunit-like protein